VKPSRLWAEVDLDALAFNFEQVRRHVGAEVGVLATVKADAYGHGAVEVARELVRCGASMLGVANVAEGAELREAGVRGPILVLGATMPEEVPDAIEHGIRLTVSPADILPTIAAEARRRDRPGKVHLMVDTGMARAGVARAEAADLARRIRDTPGVELEGIATHFALADDDDPSHCVEQMAALGALLEELRAEGIEPPIRHAANTSGLWRVSDSHLTMVRPGIGLYGMYPADSLKAHVELRPVLSLRARIAYLRDVPAGTPVGYGHIWRAPTDTRLATLPIGYADGYCRAYSNCGWVLHRGRRVPVVGRVSMDYITVELGPGAAAAVGDTVTLIGRDGAAAISAEELAAWRGTIPYEVTCALGRRVQRVYVRDGRVGCDTG
jgi:alanine racemase